MAIISSEFFNDLSQWGLAVIEHWHGWVSGGILAFGLELGDRFWDWKPSKRTYFIILALGLFYSMFSAWRDEHQENKERQKKIDALSVPDFRTRIEWATFSSTNVNQSIQQSGAWLIAGITIENHGAPSAIRSHQAYLKLSSGETVAAVFSGPPSINTPSMNLNYSGGASTIILREDYLLLRENTPVATNSALPSWVALFFPNRKLEELDNSVLHVTITDYNNKETPAESPPLPCNCLGSH